MYSRSNLSETPVGLKCYVFHGIDLTPAGLHQGVGDCPFGCGKRKFYVDEKTGKWSCHPCSAGGNSYDFIRRVWAESDTGSEEQLAKLAGMKGIINPASLTRWGVRKSMIDGTWIVPGWNGVDNLVQLYRYAKIKEGWRLLASPLMDSKSNDTGAGLFAPVPDERKAKGKAVENLYVCEGLWDGIVFEETLTHTKRTDEGDLVVTSSPDKSLAHGALVVAVPGTGIWKANWDVIAADRNVHLMYDSDFPNPNNGVRAGLDGMKKVAGRLAFAEQKPKTMWYLNWGEDGYDPNQPNGYDVRDALTSPPGGNIQGRVPALADLILRFAPVPDNWIPTTKPKGSEGYVPTLACNSWNTLVQQWKKAMRWDQDGQGLDHGLAAMLACCLSTPVIGDQLWIKVIAPASSGKSDLCAAICTNTEHTINLSVIRGFHSGYVVDKNDKAEDNSIIAKANGKTMVTKDGDTLMQSPNIEQILSEARDVYDRNARAVYRHGLDRNYKNLSITWILCGTTALKSIDKSELGQRFLDVVIMDKINHEAEDEVLNRVVKRVFRNMGKMIDEPGQEDDPAKLKAFQLTGGYVHYLRENAKLLLNRVTQDISEAVEERFKDLGRFAACLRGRPSTKQQELVEREFAPRLTSQLMRMGACLAAVLNEPGITPRVMKRVDKIAIDTARGLVLEIAKVMFRYHGKGIVGASVCRLVNKSSKVLDPLLEYMRSIDIADWSREEVGPGVKGQPRWRLTPWFAQLYARVTGEEPQE